MARKFYRTIVQVEILSEYSPITDGTDLADIAEMITTGDCSGKVSFVESGEVTPARMRCLLLEQGSDPEFFML